MLFDEIFVCFIFFESFGWRDIKGRNFAKASATPNELYPKEGKDLYVYLKISKLFLQTSDVCNILSTRTDPPK